MTCCSSWTSKSRVRAASAPSALGMPTILDKARSLPLTVSFPLTRPAPPACRLRRPLPGSWPRPRRAQTMWGDSSESPPTHLSDAVRLSTSLRVNLSPPVPTSVPDRRLGDLAWCPGEGHGTEEPRLSGCHPSTLSASHHANSQADDAAMNSRSAVDVNRHVVPHRHPEYEAHRHA